MRKKINAYLEINHAFSQKELVDWIYSKFKNLVLSSPVKRKNNGKRIAYRFFTRSLSVLTPFYDKFFKNGKKVIPNNLKLDSLGLAVWFMDDGSKSRSSIYLNTQQFTINEQKKLMFILKDQFGLLSTLNKDKSYFRIRVRSESSKKMVKIIEKYVLPSFRYKLPLL